MSSLLVGATDDSAPVVCSTLEDVVVTSLVVVSTDDTSDDSVVAAEELSAGADEELGVDAGSQSNPTLWIPISQSSSSPFCGIWKDTDTAPPHCEFFTLLPPLEHDSVCLQDEPSGMS